MGATGAGGGRRGLDFRVFAATPCARDKERRRGVRAALDGLQAFKKALNLFDSPRQYPKSGSIFWQHIARVAVLRKFRDLDCR